MYKLISIKNKDYLNYEDDFYEQFLQNEHLLFRIFINVLFQHFQKFKEQKDHFRFFLKFQKFS